MNGVMWGLINIVGPFLLLGVIIWAFMRNRKRPPSEIAEAERGAVKLREDLQRDPEYKEE